MGDFGQSEEDSKALKRAREELKRLEESLRKQDSHNDRLRKENDQLRRENKKLKEELKLLRDVPDWVKPNKGSSDCLKKGQRLGPKPGHLPFVRKRPEAIDEEIEIIPQLCPHCDVALPEPHKWHEHVQVDLPPPQKPVVRKYRVGWCWCRQCHKAVSIRGKLSHSQYGPLLHSQVAYWKFGLALTLGKIQQLLLEQYQLDLSSGVLTGILQRTSRRFQGVYADLKTGLVDQRNLYVDESGWRNNGVNHWLWSFSNSEMSYYVIHKSRGQKVVEEALGRTYSGILSSDFYGGYNALDSPKQKCWAHLLRDLKELREKYPGSTEIKVYAQRMKRFFEQGLRLQKRFQNGQNIASALKRLQADTEKWIFKKQRHKKLQTLSKRLIKYRHELYTFVTHNIEPTNNPAEREIRPAVLMRKISYGNRSDQGTQTQAILMSVIRTCQKQGKPFTQFAQDQLRRSLE
jgi:cell division protein FtsB/transposase